MSLNFVIDKIEKLEIKNKDTDIIVVSFDLNKIDVMSANTIFEQIQEQLPEYNFIGKAANDYEMSVENIDYLINELQNIKKEKENENLH